MILEGLQVPSTRRFAEMSFMGSKTTFRLRALIDWSQTVCFRPDHVLVLRAKATCRGSSG
jgi:hypothetical protein